MYEFGELLAGPFPRMGGKTRPAVCAYCCANGVVLCPGTSRKSAQAGRIALPPTRFGKGRATWLLAPLATFLPKDCAAFAAFSSQGALTDTERVALNMALESFYGDWRTLFSERAQQMNKTNRIAPLSRLQRRRADASLPSPKRAIICRG